jgi:hypothetical protein
MGKMEGVAGSMEAISGTLGGKISNLGDAWTGCLTQWEMKAQVFLSL